MQRRIFVFQPTTQGQKFDLEGEFIRQWLPATTDQREIVHEPGSGRRKQV
ncbi:FAD-binding domain-containing protein [Shigella flexneri]